MSTLPQPDCKLRIYDTSGDLKYDFKNFNSLAYNKRVNSPGLLNFSLSAEHDLVSKDFDKWQVEVWLKPDSMDWTRDFIGLIRKDVWSYVNTEIVEFTCPGLMQILRWKEILYPAKTADRTVFTNEQIETICNTLVKYNATTSGTTGDGRDRAAANGYPLTGLSVEADGGEGNLYSGGFYCTRKNLLETLQDLASIGGGDFDVVKTSSTAWQWRWYEGQRGSDKSSGSEKVIFSMGRGNMANPIVTNDRIGEKTVSVVCGAGEGSDREVEIVTSDDYAIDNDIEVFVDARDIDEGDTDGLESRGEEKLEERKAISHFQFDVLQAENSQYLEHYVVGDKCLAINPRDESELTVKIVGAGVAFEMDGKFTVSVDVEQV